MAMLPMPQAIGSPMAAMMPLATSGKQQLMSWLCGEACATARATRELRRDWKTAVALSPPSVTRRGQALPDAEMTEPDWKGAACRIPEGGPTAAQPAAGA